MAKKTILLTGAAGFIGSHAAERLLARGDRVVGLDNFNSYYSPAIKRRNVASLLTNPGFTLVEGDVRDESLIRRLFSQQRFDSVIHLGAMAGVRASVDDPHYYFDVNLTGTLRLLEACRAGGRPIFVFASTSSAYGRTERIPFIETDTADRPLAPYPASKRAAELLGHAYHHMHGLDFTAVRFFTVYGPRNRPDMLPYLVMDSIRRGKEFPLYNGGAMYRDWTYVDDIVSGLVAAADRRLGYEVINLGRGEPVHLGEFVQALSTLAKAPAKYRSAPMLAADVPQTFANIDKARRLLGYEPRVSVEEGVKRFFEWYEDEAPV
jgi:UDP-glucuronate 4-epimerase